MFVAIAIDLAAIGIEDFDRESFGKVEVVEVHLDEGGVGCGNFDITTGNARTEPDFQIEVAEVGDAINGRTQLGATDVAGVNDRPDRAERGSKCN